MTTTTTPALSLTVSPGALADALSAVNRAISTRTNLPILLNVLLEAGAGGLTLTATNLEIGIRKTVPSEVAAPWAITVPARLLLDFVACLPDAPLTMEVNGPGGKADILLLQCGPFDTTIRGIAADEFPPGPQAEGGSRLTVPLSDLLAAVEQTEHAASTDEARPVLTGEYLSVEGTTLTLAATDGHRLAEVRLVLAAPAGSDIGVAEDLARDGAKLIVPARALAELPRTFKGETAPVEVIISEARNQVFFRCGTSEVAARLIDGQYPNYEQVIPLSHTTSVRLPKRALLDAIKGVAVFARDSAGALRLTVESLPISDDPSHPKAGTVQLRGATAEVGDSNVEVDALVTGADVVVAVSARYLADAVAAIPGDEVEIRLAGPLTPILVVEAYQEDPPCRQVVMPVRVAS